MISEDKKLESICVDICKVTESEECNNVLKENNQLDAKKTFEEFQDLEDTQNGDFYVEEMEESNNMGPS